MTEHSQRLEGRVALVTGGASGIGRAVAARFREEGAEVWIGDANTAAADATAAEIDARTHPLDVTAPEQWDDLVARIVAEAGRWDVLVNAAGISRFDRPQDPEHLAVDDWRAINAVNVEGTVLGCRAAIATMKSGGGSIVNIASIVALRSTPTLAAYGASKAAIHQYTQSVAAWCALKGYAIRCNMVLPGMIDTPLVADMPADYRQAWEEIIPMGRYGDPGDVAAAVAFLASDEASYVTGSGLTIDGGIAARPPLWRG